MGRVSEKGDGIKGEVGNDLVGKQRAIPRPVKYALWCVLCALLFHVFSTFASHWSVAVFYTWLVATLLNIMIERMPQSNSHFREYKRMAGGKVRSSTLRFVCVGLFLLAFYTLYATILSVSRTSFPEFHDSLLEAVMPLVLPLKEYIPRARIIGVDLLSEGRVSRADQVVHGIVLAHILIVVFFVLCVLCMFRRVKIISWEGCLSLVESNMRQSPVHISNPRLNFTVSSFFLLFGVLMLWIWEYLGTAAPHDTLPLFLDIAGQDYYFMLMEVLALLFWGAVILLFSLQCTVFLVRRGKGSGGEKTSFEGNGRRASSISEPNESDLSCRDNRL